MTDFLEQKRTTIYNEVEFREDIETENQVVNIYPNVRYQCFDGFGGALTDSAGYIYSQLNDSQKQEMLSNYFNEENMSYRLVRIPIDSCDFSLEHYQASDKEFMEGFDMSRANKYILPLLRDVMDKVGDNLEVMLTPWSPPAFMKSNNHRNGGGILLPEYKKQWADYICTYIKKYREMGVPVTHISIQNEPKAVQTWDSCIFDGAAEKEFLKDYLWPSLQENGLEDIKVYIWDHNKERAFERACEIIDEETNLMVEGIAVHWYSGDHFDALQMIRDKFPDKKIILSEACIEYSKFSQDEYLSNAQKYAHDIIGNLNHGLTAFYDWNIILDEIGGPNHVGNYCDAPYLFNTEKKKLIERNTLAYIWHFSHFIKKGSVRIGTTTYSENLEVTAFEKDNEYSIVMLNRTKNQIPAVIRFENKSVEVILEPETIFSGVITL